MDSTKIIEKGYFPKELPPAFYTKKLADNLNTVKTNWSAFETTETTKLATETQSVWKQRKNTFYSKYGSSKCCEYSISKGKLARRVLKIPNPKHFIPLTDLLVDKWSEINDIYNLSNFSTSYPINETDINKRAVRTNSINVQDLRNKILNTSYDKLIQVKLDISKFYPTIYTHTIPWCLLGKVTAKEHFKKSQNEMKILVDSGDSNAVLYKYADKLDSAVRACQDRQSIGIPIGPDTSLIIAEIIACRIDYEFNERFKHIDIKSCRYYDDFYFFVNTNDEADIVIKGLQKLLNEFQLEINDKKVKVQQYPFPFEDEWVTDLHRFDFKKTNQLNNLKHYFSLIWSIGEKHISRTDWIFKYALRTFEYGTTIIKKDSWKLFENLLLKTALIQPAVLDIVTRILLSYESYLDNDSKEKLKRLIENVIKAHSSINHDFEMTWALWIAKSFKIEIEESIANLIIETQDCASILVLLCLDKVEGLVKGTPNYQVIELELKDDILFSEMWLLAYEGVTKGWLTPNDPDLITNNGFFKILSDLNIEFFDCSRQLKVYETIKEEDENVNSGQQEATKNTTSNTATSTAATDNKKDGEQKERDSSGWGGY